MESPNWQERESELRAELLQKESRLAELQQQVASNEQMLLQK